MIKKTMDNHLYNAKRVLRNIKPESFDEHHELHFKYTISHNDLHTFMTLKAVIHIS